MTFFEAIASGMVQGITEFLPISSSGHLVLLHAYFGFQEPRLLFDLCLHLGTVAAVFVLFWRRFLLFFTEEKKLLYCVLLGSLPTGIIGLVFGSRVEHFFVQPKVVGVGFLLTAAWLFAGERFRSEKKKELNVWSALLIGVSQGIAILPGVSRSGATIATALLLGLTSAVAVEYSFFLSIPAVFGTFLYKLFKEENPWAFSFFREEGVGVVVGMVTAMVFGIFAIRWITRIVQKGRLYFFSLYLLVLGMVTLLLLGNRP